MPKNSTLELRSTAISTSKVTDAGLIAGKYVFIPYDIRKKTDNRNPGLLNQPCLHVFQSSEKARKNKIVPRYNLIVRYCGTNLKRINSVCLPERTTLALLTKAWPVGYLLIWAQSGQRGLAVRKRTQNRKLVAALQHPTAPDCVHTISARGMTHVHAPSISLAFLPLPESITTIKRSTNERKAS